MTEPPFKTRFGSHKLSHGLGWPSRPCCKDWRTVHDSRPVEENWLFFKDRIQSAIDMFVPSKMTKQKPDLPWITSPLKRQLRKRERLLRRTKRSGNRSSPTWAANRSHQNKVTKAMKTAHNNYLNHVIGGSLQTNPKKFWSYVRQRRTASSHPPRSQR